MNEQVPSKERVDTPWLVKPWSVGGFAVYDAAGVMVVHTGVLGNRLRPEHQEALARLIADAVNAYSAHEPPAGYQCSVDGCPGRHASKREMCGSDANVPANVALLQIRAAFTEAIALLRRWRKRESDCIPAGTGGDFRLFSETGMKASDWERTFAIGDHAGDAPAPPPLLARPLNEWHEDMGDVVWWKFPVDEPAWIGSPLASDWPGYHTHWTPHPAVPEAIRYSTATKEAGHG